MKNDAGNDRQPDAVRERLNATGIGFAGIDGVWWLPALRPFSLPIAVKDELERIAAAIFTLLDVISALYQAGESSVMALLSYKVPAHIPRLMVHGRPDFLRPDFQLVPEAGGRYRLVATELEICPSAHGFAHAMQVAYGVTPDLAPDLARYVGHRPFLFVGTSQWSEFLFEQLAFCRALAEAGGRAFVLYDRPVTAIAEEVRRGSRWQPPLFGIRERPASWNDDVIGRIRTHRLEPYLWPDDAAWPVEVGDAVVFRFGYFDCFTPERLAFFPQWQARGATLLNPAMFILDSKVMMAALGLPVVREAVRRAYGERLAVLDNCIPETVLLQPHTISRLATAKDEWVLKFAGFDGGNQAWGGRSLQLGAAHTPAGWYAVLQQCLELPWPVVAQRAVPSAVVTIPYSDAEGNVCLMDDGRTRLRTFFLRQGEDVMVCGSHITISRGTMQVSEATDAVQAPVIFF